MPSRSIRLSLLPARIYHHNLALAISSVESSELTCTKLLFSFLQALYFDRSVALGRAGGVVSLLNLFFFSLFVKKGSGKLDCYDTAVFFFRNESILEKRGRER